VLHLLEHLEQESSFFTRRLGVFPGLVLPCRCRVKCRTEQNIFPFQRGNGLLHERGLRWCRACRVLPHWSGALRRITERFMPRAAGLILRRGM
jgi:hypothetical protein